VTQLAAPVNGMPVIDTVRNKIYLEGNEGIAVVDGVTLSITNIALPPPSSVLTIALNQVTNKIYVTSIDQSVLIIIDGITLSITTVPLPQTPEDVVVDTNRTKSTHSVNSLRSN
jgi:DNA-binding beta-propeller fold protein YncE